MNPRSEKLAVPTAGERKRHGRLHLYTLRAGISPPPHVCGVTGRPDPHATWLPVSGGFGRG
ncbi:MAG: hypothetical protein JNM23_08785 [Bradyrhizobiaceae bacterium]|nr:hypothetical protein [Bradyrhizobiaceae bacterium]